MLSCSLSSYFFIISTQYNLQRSLSLVLWKNWKSTLLSRQLQYYGWLILTIENIYFSTWEMPSFLHSWKVQSRHYLRSNHLHMSENNATWPNILWSLEVASYVNIHKHTHAHTYTYIIMSVSKYISWVRNALRVSIGQMSHLDKYADGHL